MKKTQFHSKRSEQSVVFDSPAQYHAVSLSGGKDSTCMLLMMIEKQMPIDVVLFADTGMEFPEMYGHLEQLEKHLQRERGLSITILRHPQGFEYVASTGECETSVEMRYEDENIWLTQKMMAALYDVKVNTINYHIAKIFRDSELQPDSVIRNYRITAEDGKAYNAKHYSLDMIIAVGFKVNSERAVQFRKWVNTIAKEYTIKGWIMDVERLKRGSYLTDKYFDEQLERIREIRASERKFYQKVTDLYATAIDYDKTASATRRFYANVQNKMHFAVHGHTAAELIMERANAEKAHMGLTTWGDAPDGKIKISDVSVAKNYLSEAELHQLERMVSAYLDFAESMTLRHIPLTMQDWETRLNSFIEMFQYGLLQDSGKVSAAIAKLHAETEFEKYRIVQDKLFESDFDRFLAENEIR